MVHETLSYRVLNNKKDNSVCYNSSNGESCFSNLKNEIMKTAIPSNKVVVKKSSSNPSPSNVFFDMSSGYPPEYHVIGKHPLTECNQNINAKKKSPQPKPAPKKKQEKKRVVQPRPQPSKKAKHQKPKRKSVNIKKATDNSSSMMNNMLMLVALALAIYLFFSMMSSSSSENMTGRGIEFTDSTVNTLTESITSEDTFSQLGETISDAFTNTSSLENVATSITSDNLKNLI
tara:strand:- start:881 stop:1573 length:693 start_codon:yes stop_codon:yes gene_type:complete